MKTVLVVDDELKITRLVRDYLQQAGFAVLTAGDGKAALASARAAKPDLVILDLGIPGVDGLEVARTIRKWGETPIIMLTARTDETDRVVGLELGADDYVSKPFSPKELVARVRAVLRRTVPSSPTEERLLAEGVTMDIPRRTVTAGDRQIELTATEFSLLAHLMRSPGRVFTRGQLLDAVHGVVDESYERAIDAHIKNIRRKLEIDPHHPQHLVTVYGVGYKFADA